MYLWPTYSKGIVNEWDLFHLIVDMHILPSCLNAIHLFFTLSVSGSKLHIETRILKSMLKYLF